MNRLIFGVVVTAVTMLATTAVANPVGDSIFAGVPGGDTGDVKLLFDHDNNPVSGTPSTAIPIPWFWHPGEDYSNVAGVKFTLKYDPYEVAILGISPAPQMGGGTTVPAVPYGFSGHIQHSTPFAWPDSGPLPIPLPNSLPSSVRGTVWVPHDIANQSGINLVGSSPQQFMSVLIQARHTSSVNLNSDIDLVVSNLQPIFHLTSGNLVPLTSVWIPYHVEPGPTGGPDEK